MLQNEITGFLVAVFSNNVHLVRWLLHPIPLALQYFCDPYTIDDVRLSVTAGYLSFGPVAQAHSAGSVLCMHSKAWLAAPVLQFSRTLS